MAGTGSGWPRSDKMYMSQTNCWIPRFLRSEAREDGLKSSIVYVQVTGRVDKRGDKMKLDDLFSGE
jgi:hypothetical protein